MDVGHIFGIVLKELRSERNISQNDLADMAELDRTYISLLERGLRQPTIETVFKIASGLNLKASEIIERVESYK